MTFIAATGCDDDPYRKPNEHMWEFFCKKLNGKVRVDKGESFYCGDEAGRKASETRPADFSDVDKQFAEYIGLAFQTPES